MLVQTALVHLPTLPPGLVQDHVDKVLESDCSVGVDYVVHDSCIEGVSLVDQLVLIGRHQPDNFVREIPMNQKLLYLLPFKGMTDHGK